MPRSIDGLCKHSAATTADRVSCCAGGGPGPHKRYANRARVWWTGGKRVWRTGGKTAALLLPSLSRFRDWNEMDFAVHRGQARVGPRYAEAVTARLAHAVPASSVAFSRD
jgi:hypothetical protein